MEGTAPTPSIRNTPFQNPQGTVRAASVNQMWRSVPAIPNDISLIYNVGIPSTDLGTFSFQNLTTNADLRFKFSGPAFIELRNGSEIIVPRSSIASVSLGINESLLKSLNPSVESGRLEITVEPLNFIGPVFVQTNVPLPASLPAHVPDTIPQHVPPSGTTGDAETWGSNGTLDSELDLEEEFLEQNLPGSWSELDNLSKMFGE